jgi:hypothetical protein
MKGLWKRTKRAEEPVTEDFEQMEALDPVLKQALGEFKSSVHAWSDAEFHRSRTMRSTVAQRTWRLAAGWGLAAVLLAGTGTAGVYEYHQRQLAAQAAAAREAERQREVAAEKAREQVQWEEDMLASVDTAVSRAVPSAMEPLIQVADENETER